MLRLLSPPLLACLLTLVTQSAAAAEPAFDYSLRTGSSTNLFDDTSRLAGVFIEAEGKLRGSIDIDGSDFSYALWHREKRLSKFHFGDERATGATLGYKTKLSDTVEFAVQGNVSRTATGDVLISVPGTVIGYRNTDWTYGLTTALGAELFGGKNTLTAGIGKVDRGTARFTTDLFLPAKLKADVTTLDLSATHIRPALSGELGFTIAYQATYIPSSEQMVLMRLPASTLRGSIAYGRKFGNTLTVITELGAIGIMGNDLSSEVRRIRPYVHTGVEWQAAEPLAFAVGYDRNFAISDPDDPIGEYTETWKFASSLKLAPKVEAKVIYEITSSEWLYYDYDTLTKRLTGTLAFELAKDHKLELEYRRIDRREKDPAENFAGDQYFARFSGTF